MVMVVLEYLLTLLSASGGYIYRYGESEMLIYFN